MKGMQSLWKSGLKRNLTEKERELISAYIVNEDIRFDESIRHYVSRLRYRSIDITDCVELMLLIQEYEDFKRFVFAIIRLLKLDGIEIEEERRWELDRLRRARAVERLEMRFLFNIRLRDITDLFGRVINDPVVLVFVVCFVILLVFLFSFRKRKKS